MNKGVLTAKLETETAMARTILLDNLPQLRDRLAEQGVRIEHFDVDVSQQDSDSTPFPSNDPDQSFDAPPKAPGEPDASEPATDPLETTHATLASVNGTLNVIV